MPLFPLNSGGGGGIGGSTGPTDNAILRADGTGGNTVQGSSATIADNGKVSITGSGTGTQNLLEVFGPSANYTLFNIGKDSTHYVTQSWDALTNEGGFSTYDTAYPFRFSGLSHKWNTGTPGGGIETMSLDTEGLLIQANKNQPNIRALKVFSTNGQYINMELGKSATECMQFTWDRDPSPDIAVIGTYSLLFPMLIRASALTFATGGSDRIVISGTGTIRFNAYGLGTISSDASGNLTAGNLITAASIKTGNYTMLATDSTILANTSSGNITITLTASPVNGRIVNIAKINAANTLTIARNGQNIEGAAADLAITTNNQNTQLQFVTGYGWKIL